MKNNIIKILIITFCLSFISCDKFLDINPKAEVINEDMFSNKRGIEDAVYGLYGSLRNNSLYGEYLSFGIPEILSQNFSPPTSNPYKGFSEYDYNSVLSYISEIWKDAYEIIGHSNNIIENLERIDPDTYENYGLYLGEAYGIRATLHFELVRLFASHIELNPTKSAIPYVEEYSFRHTPFSNTTEVYEKIIIDLKKAQELLVADVDHIKYPRYNDLTSDEGFLKDRETHFNYYAATAMLARVYWMKGDLDNAKTEALKVIESGKFPLSTKDEVLNLIAGRLSKKESIWGLYSTDFYNATIYKLQSSNSSTSIGPWDKSSGGQYLETWDIVYNKYLGENHGNDARVEWFRPPFETSIGINCLKVVDMLRLNGATNSDLIEGISMLRIPEMYYIVAEAELAIGNVSIAADYINPVLLSRGLTKLEDRTPMLTVDMDLLYNERRKELFSEGQRWFEMKKKNMDIVSNVINAVIPATDEIYVLPIPVEEFDYRNE